MGRALFNLWMAASKGQKSPRNRHFSRFGDLRARDSWLTLARSTLALGRQENVGETKNLRAPSTMATPPTPTNPTVPTVPLSKVAAELAEKTGMTKKDATGCLDDFVGLVVKNLKKGNKVRITGLGILQVRNRPARMGRNPATGEEIGRAHV